MTERTVSLHPSSLYDVLIINSFGHIKLPFGIVLASAGLQVALYDIDQSKGALIERGEMPFLEYDAEPLLQQVLGKTLHISTSLEDVAVSNSIVITISTPLDEYLNPKLLPIFDLINQMSHCLRPHHHIMLRSTVYPGTSQRVYEFLCSRGL